MYESPAIKKFAFILATLFLTPIVISVAISVISAAIFFAVIFAPFLAIKSACKTLASLYNTQSMPRLQKNGGLLSPAPFFAHTIEAFPEFVDTGKNFSKSAKSFLGIVVGCALIILFPFITLFHMLNEFQAALRFGFELLKSFSTRLAAACNPAMQSEEKKECCCGDYVKIDFAKKHLDSAKEQVTKFFIGCGDVVRQIEARCYDSELKNSGIKQDIDEIYKVQKVYFEKHLNGNFSYNNDVDLDGLKASLEKVVSFVKSSGKDFDFPFEGSFLIKHYSTTVETFFQCVEFLRKEEDKLSAAAEPSKKLDNANQSPAFGVGQSSILK